MARLPQKWLPSTIKPGTLLQSGALQTGPTPSIGEKPPNWNCINSPNGKLEASKGGLTRHCLPDPSVFSVSQSGSSDWCRQEKKKVSRWKRFLAAAKDNLSPILCHSPEFWSWVSGRVWCGTALEKSLIFCSSKGGMGRDPELSIKPRVPTGPPAHDQIPDEPPKLLLVKILPFSAHQSWIKNMRK